MPVTIPAFSTYQAPQPILPGWWNRPPKEGDRYISAEIDWITGTANRTAIKFDVAGTGPVGLSQIVSLYIDNGRSDGDVSFYFPDTAFELTVPAHAQGIYPVLTNTKTFYAIGLGVVSGDRTIVQICNSMLPPVTLIPANADESAASVGGINLAAAAVTTLVTGSGTLDGVSLDAKIGAGAGVATVALIDDVGTIYETFFQQLAADSVDRTQPNNLSIPFSGHLKLSVVATTITAGTLAANVYFNVNP